MRSPGSPLALALAQVLNLAGGLAVGVVLSRALGAAGQGTTQAALVAPAVLALGLSVGGGASISYLVSRGAEVPALLGWLAALAAGAGLVATAMGWTVPALYAPALRAGVPLWEARALAIYVPGQVLSGGLAALALGQARPRTAALVTIAGRVGQLAVLLTLWMVDGRLAVEQALAVAALAPWFGVAAGALALVRGWPRWRGAVARAALGYGLRGHFGNVAQYLSYRAGLWLVGTFLSSDQAGHYWLAVTLSELLWYLPQATAGVWLPHVARGSVSPQATAAQARALGWVCAGLGAAGTALAGWVVPRVWGPGFAAAVPLLWELLPATVFFVWAKVLAADLAGRGQPQWGTWSSVAGLASFAAVAGAGIRGWGMAALVLAQSAAYAVGGAVLVAGFIKRSHPLPLVRLFWPRRQDFRQLWALWRRGAVDGWEGEKP